MPGNRIASIALVLLVTGCSDNQSSETGAAESPDPAAPAPELTSATAPPDGKQIYLDHCSSCHEDGVHGAPAIDHPPSWASRSPEWSAVLKQHAVGGFLGMPPGGGNPDLGDKQVEAAVDYMLSRIMPPALLDQGSAQGRVVYQAACSACHDTGINGAPVIGDHDAWAARSYNWHTVLEEHANRGHLNMPAKGDQLQLFSEDVAAAVAFMVAWAKR